MDSKRRLMELAPDAAPEVPGKQAPSPAGGNVDKLFYGARHHLQQAQKMFHDLLELLQNGHQGVDSAPVADCYKATAESIDTMDQLAKKWQEEAQKANAPNPGAVTAGRVRQGMPLQECLRVIAGRADDVSFDDRPYVQERLHFERPRSLQDLQRETVFDFSRFLPEGDE